MLGCKRPADAPLLVTEKGARLYPMAVQRIVGEELGAVGSISGRKSPHVLRHTLATGLLDKGADLNSIKELLGHSSLAATQVYTHNSIEKLKNVYNNAHPGLKEEVTMEIRIQSLKFNADQKLLDYVDKKVSKIERFDDNITSVEVVLSLEERPENKAVKLQVAVPSETLVVGRTAKSFEEAVTEAVDIMKERLVRNKEKRYE